MSCGRKLPLRDPHRLQRVAPGRWPEQRKCQLVHILIDRFARVRARLARRQNRLQRELAQRLVKLLQLRRHHAVAQIHRRRRILHRAVVDHHQLLHIVRNRSARIGRQLRCRRRHNRRQHHRCNRNPYKLLQLNPPKLDSRSGSSRLALPQSQPDSSPIVFAPHCRLRILLLLYRFACSDRVRILGPLARYSCGHASGCSSRRSRILVSSSNPLN